MATEDSQATSSLPSDACPYTRPFPLGFDQCSLYRLTTFAAHHPPLGSGRPVRGCAHLVAAVLPRQRGAFYGRCALRELPTELD